MNYVYELARQVNYELARQVKYELARQVFILLTSLVYMYMISYRRLISLFTMQWGDPGMLLYGVPCSVTMSSHVYIQHGFTPYT